jgi:hypothetical protein
MGRKRSVFRLAGPHEGGERWPDDAREVVAEEEERQQGGVGVDEVGGLQGRPGDRGRPAEAARCELLRVDPLDALRLLFRGQLVIQSAKHTERGNGKVGERDSARSISHVRVLGRRVHLLASSDWYGEGSICSERKQKAACLGESILERRVLSTA